MKDSRPLRERIEEANQLVREGREQSDDETLIQKIRLALEPSVEERTRLLLSPPVEDQLREKFHLNHRRPVDSPTGSQDDAARLRQTRQRLKVGQ